MKENNITSEQIYKKNKNKAKIYKILSPIVFWIFIILTIVFAILAIENSIGNVIEILDGLDKDIHTEQEIIDNYNMFIEKYGEWQIVGNGMAGLSIKYIDISNALFSGLMITYTILTVSFFIAAIILGKICFPCISKMYNNNNEEMIDLATLKSASQIDILVDKKNKEWF